MTVEGYYDGRQYIALENVAVKENQKVQITILDDFVEDSSAAKNALLLAHYKGLGSRLWSQDAQSYVSDLRAEDRTF